MAKRLNNSLKSVNELRNLYTREERSDDAIQQQGLIVTSVLDCFAALAMTIYPVVAVKVR